jgi:probable F420-dependent oxidoreductase
MPCTARELLDWVAQCEASALDSLWQTDRLVSREPMLESLTAMAVYAGATRRIKFGMNAVVVPFRDPLLLAKQCATIDFVSNGRLLPVFGVGRDTAPEWRALGEGESTRRGRRADEALALMQRLFTEDRVDHAGAFYRYRDVSISPKPVQRPLPCWIGGASEAAIRRTARLGTGWLGGTQSPAEVEAVIGAIRAALQETGRKIDDDHYGATVAFRLGTWDDPELAPVIARRTRERGPAAQRGLAVGNARSLISHLRAYHGAGASKFVLIPLARDGADLAEQTRQLCENVVPEVHGW